MIFFLSLLNPVSFIKNMRKNEYKGNNLTYYRYISDDREFHYQGNPDPQ